MMGKPNLRKNSDGLTLIELLVTVAVLAIVSAIAVPVVNNVVSNAEVNAKKTETKIAIDFIYQWDQAGAELAINGTKVFAVFDGITAEYSDIPEGYALTGSGTPEDPYFLTLDMSLANPETTITESSGTLDDGEGTTFVRDATGVTISTASANWESMSITHSESGATETNVLTKKMSHGTSVGIVTKISNNEVRVTIPDTNSFDFGIVYNGGSTGSYTFE
jgi:prepilin-type N-terminal cleavage/methylation domain-containing protein